MNKYLIIGWMISMQSVGTVCAQWSEKDSLWLQEVLSGKEKIELSPEALKAIQSGTLINLEKKAIQPLTAPPLLPITRSFTGIAPSDSGKREQIDYSTIPPGVFALYQEMGHFETDTGLKIKKQAYTSLKPHIEKEEIQIGKSPVSIKAGAGNLFLDEVKDGQRRGSFNGTVRTYFSLDDILLSLFSKKERNKKRNKKRAAATLRYYNNN